MSSGYTSVQIIGNLVRDPELKFLQSGVAVCEITLASSRSWFNKSSNQKQESTIFIDVVLFSKRAELANEYLKKGSPVFFSGYLEMDQWEERETGKKRSKLKINAQEMRFLGSGKGRSDFESPEKSSRSNVPAEDVPF